MAQSAVLAELTTAVASIAQGRMLPVHIKIVRFISMGQPPRVELELVRFLAEPELKDSGVVHASSAALSQAYLRAGMAYL